MPVSEENQDAGGVLIRADNGDVVTFDETGLTLRLSETVLQDLRDRLWPAADPMAVLGDIDAWDLHRDGAWYRFSAELDGRGPRGYQRRVEGGDILAAAPGPLYGLLAIGGARRAGFNDAGPAFPFHVLAPGDDIGAVGLEGTASAAPCETLQQVAYATRETLLADTLLAWRRAAHRALPLFLARAETDGAGRIGDLAEGAAFENLLAAADSLCSAAKSLGKPPQALAVGLDYGLEDVGSDAAELVAGLRALMARVEREFNRRGLHKPVFLATFEAGSREIGSHPILRAHWQLAWQHGAHDLVFSAPSYMFELARFGRPTEAARIRMAEMDAHALSARLARQDWLCPLFLLAEYEDRRIRVTARALDDLVIDTTDPFGAGPACGFRLAAPEPVTIESVALAGDDPQALILTCDRAPGPGAELLYACDGPPSADEGPANRGAIRDLWQAESRSGGQPLHRWAYPAALPLHPGGGA
jgi:hypothetical protein